MMISIMTPVLVLICWTLIMLFWMGYVRFTKGFKQKPEVLKMKRTQDVQAALPPNVQWAGDNYNHLHEQPTIFYALAIYSHLVGVADPLNVGLAWVYGISRIVHSVVQVTVNAAYIRFGLFMIGSLCLIVMAIRNVLALFVA